MVMVLSLVYKVNKVQVKIPFGLDVEKVSVSRVTHGISDGCIKHLLLILKKIESILLQV